MIFGVTIILNMNKDNKIKTLSVEEYLNKIRPYLKDIINNIKKSGTSKTQLTIAINFIFSKNDDEEHVMHSKSDYIEIMINDEEDEVVKGPFESLKKNNLELMKVSEFVFDHVHFWYYKRHKINLNWGRSYMDSSDWIKN